jgi:hypothetical protein
MNPALASCAALLVALLALNPPACAHWPDQPSHQMAQLGELKLEGGGAISNLQMSYVTHGKLNAAKDNAILFLHDRYLLGCRLQRAVRRQLSGLHGRNRPVGRWLARGNTSSFRGSLAL